MKKTLSLLLACIFFITTASLAAGDQSEGLDIDARLKSMAAGKHRGAIVLVLSGGGTKGFAHVGVLKALEDMEIPIAGIVGTSIGSVIGGLYAAGLGADELNEIIMDTDIMALLADSGKRIKSTAGDHVPVGERTRLFMTQLDKDFKETGPLGMLPAMSLLSFLDQHTGDIVTNDFFEFKIPFACVATDILTGEAVVLREGSLSSAIRASIAIPGLLEPWQIGDHLLVDGGLVANLPVEIAKSLFPGYPVVAVNLSEPTMNADPASITSYFDVLMRTIDVTTVDKIKENEAMADLVIHPDLKGFSMLGSSKYDQIFGRGLEAATAMADEILALSASAPAFHPQDTIMASARVVRSIQVTGLSKGIENDIVKMYRGWIDKPYDAAAVRRATDDLTKRPEISNVDVSIVPTPGGAPGDVDVLFSATKRPTYEITLDGYTSSMHDNRWIGFNAIRRDLFRDGDATMLDGRWGNEEWGGRLRYFTPVKDQDQWGFALTAERERNSIFGEDSYELNRYSGRIMYYRDGRLGRFGLGVGASKTDGSGDDGDLVWGPYFYYSSENLDNALTPSKGYSITSQVWWNSNNTWVSHSKFTAYMPLSDRLHMIMNLGLKTGDSHSRAYRALLGSNEEMLSLSRHPYAGDQAAWAHLGLGCDFASAWWGKLRGEVFGTYGAVMERWSKERDAWEAGIALMAPGQFFNGRVFLVYGSENEMTVGFSIGTPRWWSSPLP